MAQTFQDHFSSHAASYAAFRPVYPDTLGQFLASRVASPDLVVECGCGNGQLSRLLVEHFGRVLATDASTEQLSHAIRHERIDYKQGTAEAIPAADHSADAIVVAQAVHWFDLPAFYAEARRIARPGAIIALTAYPTLEMEGALGDIVRHFNHTTLAPYWPPERALVEEGYRSLFFPFTEEDAPAIDMEAHWTFHQLIGYIQTWSAIRMIEKAGKDVLMQQFIAEMKATWGDPQIARPIHWPLRMRLGRFA